MQGEAPSWHVVEYNAGDVDQAVTERVRDLELADLPQDDDPDPRGLPGLRALLAEHLRGRTGDPQRQLRTQRFVGETAYPVGAEQTSHT